MLIYDDNIFMKFKELSIKSLDEFVPGQTYYSNTPTKMYSSFIFDTIKNNRHNKKDGWIFDLNSKVYRWLFATDFNIGDSYNPWLIFSDKETADLCKKELIVT